MLPYRVSGPYNRASPMNSRAVRPLAILLAVCCCLSVVSGQWLEKQIPLPDSLGTMTEPRSLVWDSLDDRVYVGGEGGVMVLDCATNRRLAVIPTPGPVLALCYNPQNNKVYAADRSAGTVAVHRRSDEPSAHDD